MKILLLLLSLSFSLFADQYLYVTAGGDSAIEVYKIDSSNGDLTLLEKVPLQGKPGNTALSPDKSFLYVSVRDKKENGIQTFKIGSGGKLTEAGYGKTPAFCGFLSVDSSGKYIFASHYGEGKVSYYELEGGVYKGKVLGFEATDMRAHSVRIDRENKYVYLPHTAPNKVYQFSFANGKLTPLSSPFAEGPDKENNYHEPRHCVLHPSKALFYTSNERGGGISSWKIDSNGQLSLWQTFQSLPKDFDWKAAASDIQISADGRFAYIANRDNSDRKSPTGNDSIASFLLDKESGKILKRTGITPVGRHPRSLRIDSSGKFLYGAGVHSSNITLYKMNQEDGSLEKVKEFKTGKNPMWLTCLEK